MSDWLDGIKAVVESDRAIEKAKLQALGYKDVRMLPTGQWAGLQRMIYTTGLFVGLSEYSYERRYCYERAGDAWSALIEWDGKGDPPGPWIKEKTSNRLGPGATGNHDIEAQLRTKEHE